MNANQKLEELRKKKSDQVAKNAVLKKELEDKRKEASSQDSSKSSALNPKLMPTVSSTNKSKYPITESEPIQIFVQKQEEKKLKLDGAVLTDTPDNVMKFTTNIEDADMSNSEKELSVDSQSVDKENETQTVTNQKPKITGDKEIKQVPDDEAKVFLDKINFNLIEKLKMVDNLIAEEEKDKKNEGLIEDYLFNINTIAAENKRNFMIKRVNEVDFDGQYMINDMVWIKHGEGLIDQLVVNYSTCDSTKEESNEMDYFLGIYEDQKRLVTKGFRSEIKRIISDEENSSLIYGGIDNGRIALWDIRSQKFNPDSMTNPREKIAFMPVIDLKKRENSIYAVALEGKIYAYDTRKLDEPMFLMDMFVVSDSHIIVKLESMPTSLEFDSIDPEIIYVTTSEGTIYEIGINQNSFQEKSIYQKIANAPITGLKVMDFKNFFKESNSGVRKSNSLNGKVKNCNYFLTSSFDWNVKFFKETLSNEVFVNNYHNDFVTSIDVNNQLCPFTYASADVEGKLAVWKIDSNFMNQPIIEWSNPNAISKVKFSPSGLQLAVGDVKGGVNLLSFTRSKMMISDKMMNYYLQNGIGKLFSD